MTSKFVRALLAIAVTLTFSALAQTGSAATPSNPAATPANPLPSAPGMPTTGTGAKVGTINIQEAIFGCNEGQRDMQTLQKKYEPKSTELKSQNDEIEALKKQLSTQQGKLNPDAEDNLKKQIESKQKSFDRSYQDFQEEVGGQQQDIAKRVLQKMAPMIVKYSQDNGFGIIVDTSKPWPESNVLWWNEQSPGIDITRAVVEAYNVQSGVPAPAPPAGAAPKTPGSTPAKPNTGAAPRSSAPKPSEPPKQ